MTLYVSEEKMEEFRARLKKRTEEPLYNINENVIPMTEEIVERYIIDFILEAIRSETVTVTSEVKSILKRRRDCLMLFEKEVMQEHDKNDPKIYETGGIC